MITGGFTISERGVSVLEDWEMREPAPSIVVSVVGGSDCLPSSLALTSASPPPPPPTPTTELVDTASFTTTTEEATPTPSEGTTKQDDPELEELRAMVSKTKGYFARDWSLYLGWNNMRYIIEAALEQSRLLNRTLILPSFVYARACEWEIEFCAAFAPMVNRGKAVHSNAWDNLPAYQQIAYRIPIEIMLDIPHLRKVGHPVVLTSQFLRLSGINDPDLETTASDGHFEREKYLGARKDGSKMTLFEVKLDDYDPKRVVRVDRSKALTEKFGRFAHGDVGIASMKLWEKVVAKEDHTMIKWEDARDAVKEHMRDPLDDEELERVLGEMGWIVVHTWDGWSNMEWLKSVVQPIKQVAPLRSIRGWQEDYAFLDHDVVLLEGEIHLGRKPGAMFFSTPEARDNYARIVLQSVRPIDKIRELGEELAHRMRRRVGGRMWMSGHMRRGDFIREGWVMEQSISDHLLRIKLHLANGSEVLHRIQERRQVILFGVPDVEPDQTQLTLQPPEDGDPFFLATDERFANNIIWLRQNKAVLISDLLTPQDHQKFGWPLMITDVLALLEQVVISHSYYFYAHAMSSLAGGAVNMRAAKGKDYRTSWID
ncbi:hypothetical protein FS837_010058 [Tulasnella sp. UAMH 9824]|nr:hypothetical protein FS837_010058 [Tulasnella sp. UAMH 9824]